MIYGDIRIDVIENECVNERNPLSKAKILLIIRDNLETVGLRDRMQVNIIY